MQHHNIAARVLNRPLLLEPGYARVFIGALAGRLGIASLHDETGLVEPQEKLRMRADAFTPQRERIRPYQVVDGVALVPVSGSLVHKYGYLQPYSGMTGYDGLIARVEQALDDDGVSGILLDIDSPGGEVSGCFDAARRLAQLRGTKPIASIAYDTSCSAAMALHSATDYRYVTETSRSGSVGVVMMHSSFEKQLTDAGIEVTLIHSGALKVDGNPYQNLSDEVLARFKGESDKLRRQFAEMVSLHIGNGLSVDAVMATEAGIYTGQDAIDIGFANELINGHDMIAAFSDYIATSKTRGVSLMTAETTAPAPAATEPKGTTEPKAQGPDLEQQARASEQARIQGIMSAEAAQGRTELASHLAFKTGLSVDEAVAIMAASPTHAEASTDAPAGLLSAAMKGTKQPAIGAAKEDLNEPESKAGSMVADYNLATGRPATAAGN